MAKFILSYHQPRGYVPESDSDAMAAWGAYFERIGESVADPSQPVFERTAVGEVGSSTQLGGYSIVNADDLEAAAALAKLCPSVQSGGGVQVGLLAELPADRLAEQLRQQASQR